MADKDSSAKREGMTNTKGWGEKATRPKKLAVTLEENAKANPDKTALTKEETHGD